MGKRKIAFSSGSEEMMSHMYYSLKTKTYTHKQRTLESCIKIFFSMRGQTTLLSFSFSLPHSQLLFHTVVFQPTFFNRKIYIKTQLPSRELKVKLKSLTLKKLTLFYFCKKCSASVEAFLKFRLNNE